MTEPIRLAKRIAELRACSRREAEQVITGGWVKVDGVVIEEPHFRVADQCIEIDPRANPAQTEPVTLLLHKPPGYVMPRGVVPAGNLEIQSAVQLLGAASLWTDDASGIHPLKMHFTQLTACVPLDTSAGGLVVFTQDWHVARKLTDDGTTLEHEVVVEVEGEMPQNGLERLNRGIPFEGRAPASIKVSWQNETHLRVALKGARIGQIEHLCKAVGLKVVAMKRIRLGRVSMGKLPVGEWRYLRGDERF
jgi:23S rRNA pseudouridine2604 synthase